MLPFASNYAELCARFCWRVPADFAIPAAVVDRYADGSGREAVVELDDRGGRRVWSFDRVAELSRRAANLFAAHGIGRGDRLAILLGQRIETLIAHLGAWRIGAITVPLFSLFGPDALAFRLRDSGARLVISDRAGCEKIAAIRDGLCELSRIFCVDGPVEDAEDFHAALARASDRPPQVATGAEDPALIIYTSGTTGAPKGALHAHRVLLGHLPGVQMPHEFFPQPGDRFWTPADWAWIGGLLDVLLPSLFFGVPVVAWRAAKFDPEAAVAVMAREGIRNVFMPPTALRLMRRAGVDPYAAGVRLRTVGSGGESLGADMLEWGRARLGVTINEFYGQTEANLLVSNMAGLIAPRPGSMGMAVPGHEVAVLGPDGTPLPPGETGVIAVRRPDPVMFLGYWRNPEATATKFAGDWMLTGDLGRRDEEGWFTYLGREDDLINSAGYRIGPTEVETVLARHPAVALCAVIGVPDPVRGEIVKAYIVPQPGVVPDEALADSIRAFVRERLAAHAYPRSIAFVEDLPRTATGKIRRAELREAERRKAASEPTADKG
ncbi:Acetyl-coenzyme A synthetase [bacterium HR40]|nr:Acetyl-coenzyme A synthetase [bacterium HR40]